MTLYYEGSDGSVIDLMGEGIYAQDPENLAKSSWEYSTISGVNGLGRVKRFYKDTQETTVTLGIMADDADEFNAAMYRLHQIFDRDIRRMKPGKLWWNGFYKEVFAVETSQEEFEELFGAVNREVTFISVYPYWIKKTTYKFLATSGITGTLDYDDFDFEYDYDLEEVVEAIENDCIDKANFEITFHGPCQNPGVTIGSHLYEVLTNLSAGEYVTINSLHKTVVQHDLSGEEENVFYLRGRDEYIFEPIPEGARIPIVRNQNLALDITVYDERGEPEWI